MTAHPNMMSSGAIFPPIDPMTQERLVRQARVLRDDAAYHTLLVLSTRPRTFKIQAWPTLEIEMGVN